MSDGRCCYGGVCEGQMPGFHHTAATRLEPQRVSNSTWTATDRSITPFHNHPSIKGQEESVNVELRAEISLLCFSDKNRHTVFPLWEFLPKPKKGICTRDHPKINHSFTNIPTSASLLPINSCISTKQNAVRRKRIQSECCILAII